MTYDTDFELENFEDLKSIEFSDKFIEKNIHNLSFEVHDCRQTLNSLCETFVMSFLGDNNDTLALLYDFSKGNDAMLNEVEKILQTFTSQLNSIQTEISVVQESVASKSVRLNNILSTEAILWSAISGLVIPPEVVRVITGSNEEQLGTQFRQSVKELYRFLKHRTLTWIHPGTVEVRHRKKNSQDEVPLDRQVSTREHDMRMAIMGCAVYKDLMDFMDSLTLYACSKIESFLSHKLDVLTIKGTNIWIQQQSVLKPLSFYVQFMRSAAPLLSRDRHSSCYAGDQKGIEGDAAKPPQLAYQLYEQFKMKYCRIMTQLYLKRVQGYVFTCNSLEFNISLPGQAVEGKAKSDGLGLDRSASSDVINSFYALPLITDPQTETAPELLQLGDRGRIFSCLFSPPIVPLIERANRRRHSYEETFRSILSLMCDITTHEYIFTCDFFGGDPVVFTQVFRPTIQFIVDYIAEVVLCQCSGEVRQMLYGNSSALVNESIQKDTYGIVIMIRLCYEFRSMMRYTRKLYCLDGLFDSLLSLLLPVYKKNLEKQFTALSSVMPVHLAQSMSLYGSTEAQLRVVHPIVKSFTEFSCVLMSLLLGTILSEERYRAEEVMHPDKFIQNNFSQSTTNLSYPISAPEAPTFETNKADSSLEELRALALQRLVTERQSEAEETRGQILMMISKLEFIQLNVIQLMRELGDHIVQEESDSSVRGQFAPLKGCFTLNNMYYILNHYHQRHIILSQIDLSHESEEGSTVLINKHEELLPLDMGENFQELKETYLRYRTEFVESIIRMYMSASLRVVQNSEHCSTLEIKEATESFMLFWQSALDSIVKSVHQLIVDPTNLQQIIAQICTDILLYNTRFHGIVWKAFEKDPAAFGNCPLRSRIVTNQTLLQYMREGLSSLPLSINAWEQSFF